MYPLTALHVLNAQPAELLAADAVIEQGGQYRPIAHALMSGGASSTLRASASPRTVVLASLLLDIGRLPPSTGLPATALRSQR
jgi:hypothetical protein